MTDFSKAPKIKPIGKFFPQKTTGEIINPTHFELIPNHWLPAIQEVCNNYLENFKQKVHSIWIRGSVPRGMVVDGVSDLDTFVILRQKEDIRWESVAYEAIMAKKICRAFPFIADVEAKKCTFSKDFPTEKPKIAMLIKTQSLLWHGQDIRLDLPTYFPDQSMMLHYRWLEADLVDFLNNNDPQQKDFQAIAKIFLRVGFELVMIRVGSYTTDLYICYQSFAQYYPAKAEEMFLMLKLFVNPSEIKPGSTNFVARFGKWLAAEVNRVLF